MGYTALERMRQLNIDDYGITGTVRIPRISNSRGLEYGQQALEFIREDCEDLFFKDGKYTKLTDNEGRSSGPKQIPYNMERDLDRLCFEVAISRFLESGSREDAFDIYYCYCEIFKPFGENSNSARILLELLSEHESNASSLMMKHRDHYSHAVYVFLLGLAIYRNHKPFRDAYNRKYNLQFDPAMDKTDLNRRKACIHFLRYWGLTALFHDIGYPFEIAHQQINAYVTKLGSITQNAAPYVSYGNMAEFAKVDKNDLNQFYAKETVSRLKTYLTHNNAHKTKLTRQLKKILADRAVFRSKSSDVTPYVNHEYMDHAYFSAITLAKTCLTQSIKLDSTITDCFCAILLHNSLFRYTIREILFGDEKNQHPLSLKDGQPLTYLLMLCDELQCWNRISYGHSTRKYVYACDFDMTFPTDETMEWTYYYDSTYADRVEKSKSWKKFILEESTAPSIQRKICYGGKSQFVEDIAEILCIDEMVYRHTNDITKIDDKNVLHLDIATNTKRTGMNLSSSNYLNLYNFAVALHGQYATPDDNDYTRAFEEDLSLEYKLSNIALAKGFSAQLKSIGCFYTDRPVDYPPVNSFMELTQEPGHAHDWEVVSKSEHERWCAEKTAMGWRYGTGHCKTGDHDIRSKVELRRQRERTRHHNDLVKYHKLNDTERNKNSNPMQQMLDLILESEGLIVYRIED